MILISQQHIEDVLTHPGLSGVDYLFLVGGFAESPLLQQAVRSHFGDSITVVIPQVILMLNFHWFNEGYTSNFDGQDVSLAILKGAVLYGLNPRAITVRRSRLTYGVAVLNRKFLIVAIRA